MSTTPSEPAASARGVGLAHHRVMEILADALEIDRAQRAGFLEQACGGDAALRAEVERLLGGESKAADALATKAGALNLLESLTPKEVGRYRIIRPLGEGGMGVVYLAAQQVPVKRVVALKLVRPGMDSREVIARFESERQALAMMSHPNVAQVLDAGTTELGRPYFVMEYVAGVPITAYCDEHRFGVRQRLELFVHVCEAIQHAHQKGIIHRDLKPTNVLISEHEPRPIPKVIDFGVAKAVQQSFTDRTLYTERGQLIGTPEYMSPEQADGSGLDIDTRSDIYSLGVLLYELLTGTLPIDPTTLRKSGVLEIQRSIREIEPPSPSKRLSSLGAIATDRARARATDAGTLRRQLRGDLDWIVMKAMEKDRTRRYDSASALGSDVQRYLRDEPVLAGPPSTVYVLRKFARRHRAALTSAGLLAGVLLAAVVVSGWLAIRARHAEAVAVANEKKAQTEAQRSEQVARFLSDMLRGVNPSVARGRDTTLLREILDHTAERIGADLKAAPLVEADLRNTLGQTYYGLGLYPQAEQMWAEALRLRQQTPDASPAEVAESISALGAAQLVRGNLAAAEANLRQSLEMRRQALGENDPAVAESLNNVASVLRARGDLAGAEQHLRQCAALLEKIGGPDQPRLAATLGNLAGVLRMQFKLDEAEQFSRRALELRRKMLGDSHPETAVSLNSLGVLMVDRHDLDAAEPLLREALEIRRRIFNGDHPDLSESLLNMGRLYTSRGDRDQALPYAMEAAEMRKRLFGTGHPAYAQALFEVALLEQRTGKPEVAEQRYREIIEVYERAGRTHDDYYAGAWQRLGRLYSNLNRLSEAQNAFEEAVKAYEKKASPGDWRAGYARVLLGGSIVRQAQQRIAAPDDPALIEAEKIMLPGYEAMQGTLPIPASSRRYANEELAMLYDARGMPEKAAGYRALAATRPATTRGSDD